MKRKLTSEEEKLEKLGLERNKKELELLKKQLEYNQDVLNQQKLKMDHEDKWRSYLRGLNDQENEKTIANMKTEIKIKENTIKTAEEHLLSGVEVKLNKAVGD